MIKKYLTDFINKQNSLKINEIKPFLDGNIFNEGLIFNISTICKIKNRQEAIIEKIKNKKVIHVGCVDHLEIIDKKIKDKTWLHSKITDESTECIGLDINKKGIDYLKKELHYENVYYCDLTKPSLEKLTREDWDIMVLGEIIEHVNDPYNFLVNIFNIYKNNVKEILITVPNSLSYQNFYNAKKEIEIINSDHKTIFSPYTLTKILNSCGFKVKELFFADSTYKLWHKILNKIIKIKLFKNKKTLSNTIILIANFK